MSRLARALDWYRRRTFSARLLLAVWALFTVLVLSGIHGSSINASAKYWKTEKADTTYLFDPLVEKLKPFSKNKTRELSRMLCCEARDIRSDEWLCSLPWTLAQCEHSPRFPVVNTRIGLGQNMLLLHPAPVWHIASIARPSTWGFMLLGPLRGVAWQWWFPPFAGFTALFLLLQIVLKDRDRLAAFGAFWFCGSAFVVGWSQSPAYTVFFPALSTVAAYHLLSADTPRRQLCCGLLLGLALAGFVMLVYPPWQVSIGYVFLLLFAGLFVRERLYQRLWQAGSVTGLAVAAVVSALLISAFIWSCHDAITLMANTAYPGRRICTGGDYEVAVLLRGFYNLFTLFQTPSVLRNESEATSCYMFFPAVFAALPLFPSLRRQLGLIGWLLIGYIALVLCFLFVGFPEWLAKATWFSYCPPFRIDLSLGLASILLSTYVLSFKPAGASRLDRCGPWLGAIAMLLILLAYGVILAFKSQLQIDMPVVLGVALGGALLAGWLLAGNAELFCPVLTLLLIATAALFNPLSRDLNVIYRSEMAREIRKLQGQSGEPQTWLCYGDRGAELLYALGCRTVGGIHYHPQMELWRRLDVTGAQSYSYNRYAHVQLAPRSDTSSAIFEDVSDVLRLHVSPLHPAFRDLNPRYVLAVGGAQADFNFLDLKYRSPSAGFSIFELPAHAGTLGVKP